MGFRVTSFVWALIFSSIGCFDAPEYQNCVEDSCNVSGDEGRLGANCSEENPCGVDGLVCVDGACAKSCADDSQCAPDQICRAQICAIAECQSPEDCSTPGICESSLEPSCVDGRCEYQRESCEDAPADSCSESDDVFLTYLQTGACNEETGSCEYPFEEQDCPSCDANCLSPCEEVTCVSLNGGCSVGRCEPVPGAPATCVYQSVEDGSQCTRQNGATGTCTDGLCLECVRDEDCDDDNACTSDQCNLERTVASIQTPKSVHRMRTRCARCNSACQQQASANLSHLPPVPHAMTATHALNSIVVMVPVRVLVVSRKFVAVRTNVRFRVWSL